MSHGADRYTEVASITGILSWPSLNDGRPRAQKTTDDITDICILIKKCFICFYWKSFIHYKMVVEKKYIKSKT